MSTAPTRASASMLNPRSTARTATHAASTAAGRLSRAREPQGPKFGYRIMRR